jgi:hypothetical protein
MGKENPLCQMVTEQTANFPTEKCKQMVDNYDQVIQQLRMMENQMPPGGPGGPGGPGMRPPGMPGGGMPPGHPGAPPGGMPPGHPDAPPPAAP